MTESGATGSAGTPEITATSSMSSHSISATLSLSISPVSLAQPVPAVKPKTALPPGAFQETGRTSASRCFFRSPALPALDFLALLVPHIALRNEVTIRSYGAASTTFRRKAGWIQAQPVKQPPPRAKPTSLVGPAGNGVNDPIPTALAGRNSLTEVGRTGGNRR